MKKFKALLIFCLISISFSSYGQSTQDATQSTSAQTIPVYAIDLDADSKLDTHEVLHDQDGILLLKTKNTLLNIVGFDVNNFGVINANALMSSLDVDANGRVDVLDPTYSKLYLMIFSKEGVLYRIVSLKDVGIRALFLPKYRAPKATSNIVMASNQTEGSAIMANSTKRTIRIIDMDAKYFDNLKLMSP